MLNLSFSQSNKISQEHYNLLSVNIASLENMIVWKKNSLRAIQTSTAFSVKSLFLEITATQQPCLNCLVSFHEIDLALKIYKFSVPWMQYFPLKTSIHCQICYLLYELQLLPIIHTYTPNVKCYPLPPPKWNIRGQQITPQTVKILPAKVTFSPSSNYVPPRKSNNILQWV